MDDHKAENHERIWLVPRCNVDDREWCEAAQPPCDECGEPAVEYIRADIAKAEIERLRAALKMARQWMPIQPIDESAKADVALVDQALEQRGDSNG